ncbi:hypothetical protein HMPREF9332_01507 [Alloprevotella rava F0323]|uniref:Glycosyl transferase family 1 domain-containing protein n=1 Tax=Alloprevotella rava F0323 TaxID=679199 RepID=G5GD78_9BACT|nr:glycosyltransferase family 1 protein [Alloprevotella rava]EHG21992.1 hypothetical protein HMPREF9332_01507 [Alloprevotella rava F0323]
MHIGYDAKRLFNNFTGLGNYSRTLIDTLTAEFPDNEYLLYTPKIKDDATVRSYCSKEHCQTRVPEGIVRGSLWRSCGLARDLQRDKVDLFHGLSHELPHGLAGVRIPAVVTMHDVAWRTFPAMYHRWDRAIYDFKARHACREAQRIVAISEATKRDVCDFYNVEEEKVEVIYQPVQELYYAEPNKELAQQRLKGYLPQLPADYLLYVGSVNSRKNLLGIVRALEAIPAGERLPLVVVGNGREYLEEVNSYVRSHQLSQWFLLFTDIHDNRLLRYLYECAAAFVYPSFSEGFGLPVVEAQLCGTPVVTSNVSCLPEAGGPHALLADPAQPESIAHAIRTLLADDDARRQRGRNSRQWAFETFAPARLAKQMMQMYRGVVGEK